MPGLKIIGDVDPSDVAQGAVGDCWLVAALASAAEHPACIRHAFLAKLIAQSPVRPWESPTNNFQSAIQWDLLATGELRAQSSGRQ